MEMETLLLLLPLLRGFASEEKEGRPPEPRRDGSTKWNTRGTRSILQRQRSGYIWSPLVFYLKACGYDPFFQRSQLLLHVYHFLPKQAISSFG